MPIYEYQCPKGHEFERLVRRVTDIPTEATCPTCLATAQLVHSIPSPAQFFGDGWYKPSPQKRYSTKVVSREHGNSKV